MLAIASSADHGPAEKPAASVPLNNPSSRIRTPAGVLSHHILSSNIIAIQMEQGMEDEEKQSMSPPRNGSKQWLSSSIAVTRDRDTHSASSMQKIPEAPPPPPPPPPIPRPCSLRRHMSEPVPPRRKIFDQFWSNSNDHSKGGNRATNPSPPQLRRRSASVSIPQRISTTNNDIDIRNFSPPCRKHCLKSSFFLPIEELPEELEENLPDLPQPLQRFYHEGKQAPLRGMYPLITPVSILRESSYTAKKKPPAFGLESRNPLCHDPSPPIDGQITFHLTDTYRGRSCISSSSDPGLDATSNSSSSQGGSGRAVHFDPRVTVTSFEEKTKREWFTDSELERFKWETIRRAQKFLMMHPELIAAYSMPRLDTVTGTLRKKPLFSMSVLAIGSDDSDSDSDSILGCMTVDDSLVHQEVQNILVVDRNRLILDLFRRSLQPLFPRARIITLQSGEEALRLFHEAYTDGLHRSFDIVVAEQALQRPLITTGTPLVQSGKSTNELQNRAMISAADASIKRNLSLTNLSASGPSKLSGCELFAAIRKTESMTFDTEPMDVANVLRSIEASSMCPIALPALLIGVTMHPEADTTLFLQSGADCIWGKPPPKMNDSLRDELVLRLVGKRHPVDSKTR